MSRRGGQVVGGVFVEWCRSWVVVWFIQFGAGAVECVACQLVVAAVGVDGGLRGGEPGDDDRVERACSVAVVRWSSAAVVRSSAAASCAAYP
ncbi:MAG: hypothetical protein ACJ72I_07995 [Pseudonocardiaceae bacterium]